MSSKVSEPFKNIWRKEGRKHPKGGKKFIDAVDKRHLELKEMGLEEKKLCSQWERGYYYWTGVESPEELGQRVNEAINDFKSGNFFLERIGRLREVDMKLSLVLNHLRTRWIEEHEIKTAPEFMLLDMALTGYFHFLRLNEAINNIMANIDQQMFELEAPQFTSRDKWGVRPYGEQNDKAVAETLAHRLNEILLPTLEQYNRMFIRNLKAIRDLKRGNVLLNIGSVGQMNIGEKQVNVEKSALQNEGFGV